MQERFVKYLNFNWKSYFKQHYGVVLLSLLAGTVSHLVWDSFTHPEGRGVRYFPFLLQQAFGGILKMKLYSFLQKVGSVLGVLALVGYSLQLRREKRDTIKRNHLAFWMVVGAMTLGVILLRLQLQQRIRLENLYHLTIILISGGLTSLVLSPLLLRAWKVARE